jgi:hypothetical protein
LHLPLQEFTGNSIARSILFVDNTPVKSHDRCTLCDLKTDRSRHCLDATLCAGHSVQLRNN